MVLFSALISATIWVVLRPVAAVAINSSYQLCTEGDQATLRRLGTWKNEVGRKI